MRSRTVVLFVITICLVAIMPRELLACPICFGADPDSDIAQGVNWSVFTLLGITGGVLSGFVGFVMHLMKKSREAMGFGHDQEPGADGLGNQVGGSTFNG